MGTDKKIYKPKVCEDCLVCKKEKGMVVCGVMKELKANANNTAEKFKMWKKCPLDWDK